MADSFLVAFAHFSIAISIPSIFSPHGQSSTCGRGGVVDGGFVVGVVVLVVVDGGGGGGGTSVGTSCWPPPPQHQVPFLGNKKSMKYPTGMEPQTPGLDHWVLKKRYVVQKYNRHGLQFTTPPLAV